MTRSAPTLFIKPGLLSDVADRLGFPPETKIRTPPPSLMIDLDPSPLSGELWTARDGEDVLLVLVVGVDNDQATVIPADFEPGAETPDSWVVSVFGLRVTVWTDLMTTIPLRLLRAGPWASVGDSVAAFLCDPDPALIGRGNAAPTRWASSERASASDILEKWGAMPV